LSVLAKGPVGFAVLGLVAVVALLLVHGVSGLTSLLRLPGLLVATAVFLAGAAPWPLVMLAYDGLDESRKTWFQRFVVYDLLGRVGVGVHGDRGGLEYYVRHKIDGNEITWFPLNKAMRLPASDSRTEEMQKKLAASVEAAQAGITSRLGDLQSDVGSMLENLTDVLRDVQQYAEETEQGEQEEQEWFPALGYDISLGVVEVSGAEQPEEELRLLNLRVIADSGMYSCNTTGVDMARKAALFDGGALFLVGENAQPSDKNPSLSIQILQGTGAGASKFIGVVELSLGELLQQEQECTIDRPFQRMGQVADCVITLKVEWEQARTFASSD
jgi:hypothetical protein